LSSLLIVNAAVNRTGEEEGLENMMVKMNGERAKVT
jgi:hypothetical protein